MNIIKNNTFSIESTRPDATYNLSNELKFYLSNKLSSLNEIVILCVGTDRSTGDCLGPLVGDKLTKLRIFNSANILGTLNDPVHAKNIEEITKKIYNDFNNPFIIAIDASLGKNENVGKINLFDGPIYPGSGVNKNLKPIGDISITGIVNISGFMEYIILQNTRLSLVMNMADIISMALYMSLRKLSICKSIVN